MKTINALLLLAACALTACAGEQVEEGSAIHTAGIGEAPHTQASSERSMPLSSTNTPDAIAAKIAAARAVPPPPPNPAYVAAHPNAPAAARAPYSPSLAAAPAAVAAVYTSGASVAVRDGAVLRSRPNTSSDSVQSLVLNNQVKLVSHVYNAGGHWWFVEAGKETGWMLQTDFVGN